MYEDQPIRYNVGGIIEVITDIIEGNLDEEEQNFS